MIGGILLIFGDCNYGCMLTESMHNAESSNGVVDADGDSSAVQQRLSFVTKAICAGTLFGVKSLQKLPICTYTLRRFVSQRPGGSTN